MIVRRSVGIKDLKRRTKGDDRNCARRSGWRGSRPRSADGTEEAWTRGSRSRRIAAWSATATVSPADPGTGWKFAEVDGFGYAGVMYATAVVDGKVVRFRLSPALARAHRENRGKTMTDQEAVEFVERKRRARALRRAKPYLESRS